MRRTCLGLGLAILTAGCFEDPEATSSGTESDTTSSSPGSSGTSVATSGVDTTGSSDPTSGSATDDTVDDTGVPASCGNGREDPGEDCDDGNDVDADGCTRTCEVSGTERWVTIVGGGGVLDQRAQSVTYAPEEDSYYVLGMRSDGDGDGRQAWHAKITPDGDFLFDLILAPGGAKENLPFGSALAPDGTVVYTGNTAPLGDVFVRRIDAAGTIVDSESYGGAGEDLGIGVAIDSRGRVVVVGREVDGGMLQQRMIRAYEDDLSTVAFSSRGGPTPATAREVTWSESAGAYFVVGYQNAPTDGWIDRIEANGDPGWSEIVDATAPLALLGVTSDATNVYACGFELTGDVPFRAHFYAWDAVTGAAVWSQEWDGLVDAGAYCDGLAIDQQGDLVMVGGSVVAGGSAARPLVRKMSAADGSERWATVVVDESADVGWFEDVAIGTDNTIIAVGNAGATVDDHVPILAGFAP